MAVLTHGTGHETQVLEQQQLTVRIEAIECFEPVGKDFVSRHKFIRIWFLAQLHCKLEKIRMISEICSK